MLPVLSVQISPRSFLPSLRWRRTSCAQWSSLAARGWRLLYVFKTLEFFATANVCQQQLSVWGEACDDDVSDVTDKLGVLIYEIGELEDQFVDRYDQYRVTIKSIRNIEASVQPSRDRKSDIIDIMRPSSNIYQASRRSLTRLLSSSTRSQTHQRLSFSSKSSSVPRPSLSSPRLSSLTSPARS